MCPLYFFFEPEIECNNFKWFRKNWRCQNPRQAQKFRVSWGWVQFLGGLKFFTLLEGGTTGFSLLKNYSSLPPGKVFPVDSPHQIFIPPSLNSTFLLKIFFSEFYHDIKNTLIYKVNCNLKLSLNSMKLMCFILS